VINISITSAKARQRDPYSPIEFPLDPPVAIRRPGDLPTLLSDRHQATISRFVRLVPRSPKNRRCDFLDAVMSRLAGGKPGDAAVLAACIASAQIDPRILHKAGLVLPTGPYRIPGGGAERKNRKLSPIGRAPRDLNKEGL
jgi:hypothetical protein